ncbi:MAG: MaoC family dehydratase [Myxococcales bacterium]
MSESSEETVVVREIDRWRSIYYAAASGDFNPIHLDAEIGQLAGLGGIILQGMCTLAMGCEAAVAHVGGDPGALRRVKVRFSRPVRPGDTLTFTVRTEAVRDGRAQLSLQAVNQDGEAVLSRATLEADADALAARGGGRDAAEP